MIVDDALSPEFPLGPSLEVFVRREAAERFIEEVRDAAVDNLNEKPETAYDRETMVLALAIDERELIIHSLADPPDSLAELRGVLLREHEWRVREGLVETGAHEGRRATRDIA